MKNKNASILWTISLLVICFITIIGVGCNVAGIDLPDSLVRIMGVLDLCAIPVLIYSTVRITKKNNKK